MYIYDNVTCITPIITYGTVFDFVESYTHVLAQETISSLLSHWYEAFPAKLIFCLLTKQFYVHTKYNLQKYNVYVNKNINVNVYLISY